MKQCTKCKVEKSLEEYHNNIQSKDGKASRCKLCSKEYSAKKYKENPHKMRVDKIFRKYGLTEQGYNQLLQKQNFNCKICEKHTEDNLYGKLYVDHCHRTGIVRGLLCHKCNSFLGLINDDENILNKAIQYLREPK